MPIGRQTRCSAFDAEIFAWTFHWCHSRIRSQKVHGTVLVLLLPLSVRQQANCSDHAICSFCFKDQNLKNVWNKTATKDRTSVYFNMFVIQKPWPMCQQFVYFIQVFDFLWNKVDAFQPFGVAIVKFELGFLFFDEEETFVTCGRNQCYIVSWVIGQRTLAVHKIIVKVQKVFKKLRLKAHYLYDVVHFAILCIEFIK